VTRLFQNTVSALCYDLARRHCPAAFPYNDVVNFVLRQHARMPAFLRFPLAAATICFGIAGRRYHRQSPDQRVRRVEAWQGARLGACRDLMRFFESLVVVALYSREAGG